MKKIDFFYEKRDLHRKMHEATMQLVKMTKDGIIEFDNKCDTAYAYFEPDGYSSVVGIEVDAVRFTEGFLEVHDSTMDMDCSGYFWYTIGEGSSVIWCTIDLIYEAAYDSLVRSDGFELIRHGGEEYLCRYVHSSDVGVDDIDENILIAPPTLLESINVIDGGENEEIDKKVYYYAYGDIMTLPYKEFCERLKEEGIC